jgi:phenylacetate-CoA ligase
MEDKEKRGGETGGPDVLTKAEILDLQNNKFRNIINYVGRVPFYRKKLAMERVNLKQICDISDLEKLPFTTKKELRETHPMERTSLGFERVAFLFSSSGTTGLPTIYPWSTKDERVLRKVAARCMKRVGIGPGDMGLVVAPFGMPIMWYCMVNQYLAAGAGVVPLGLAPPDVVIKAMSTFPITAVATLPAVATRAIEIMKREKTPFVKNRLRHFHFGGDYLSNARRRRIEDYFGVQCYDFYGLSEIFGPFAGECKQKDGLHLASDYVLVEVIDPYTKEPVHDGEMGVAVYTTLWEKAAPLLRFWSDDYISVTWERCECGRTSPRIRYEGRPFVGVSVKRKWIFAKNIEEIVMSFPEISGDWKVRIEGKKEKPSAKLYLEDQHVEIPSEKIEEAVASLLGMPVKIEKAGAGFWEKGLKSRIVCDF